MKTITFLLPVRIDTQDRLFNINICLKYLTLNYPGSEIILIEDDKAMKCKDFEQKYSIRYYFRQNTNSFSRARNINFGLLLATRDFFAVWDVDCLVQPQQMIKANQILSKGNIHIVLPHNEIFVNIKGSLKEKTARTLKLEEVPQFRKLPKKSFSDNIDVYPIPSGVVIFNKNTLLRIGGFNKKMISYGWEDIEVLKRAEKLGMYYFSLTFGNIIHLDHARGNDSKVNNYYEINKQEFDKVISMPKKQLIDYVNNELSLDKSKYAFSKSFRNKIKSSNIKHFTFLRFLTNRIYTKLHAHPSL